MQASGIVSHPAPPAQSFTPDRLYYSTLNREVVQGSILTRHSADPAGWHPVLSLSPLVLETVAGPVEIPADCDPRLVVKAAIYRHQLATGQITRKARPASRAGQLPKKSTNYAALVAGRAAGA